MLWLLDSAVPAAQAYTLAWLPMHNILRLSSDSVIWTMFVMATAARSSALGLGQIGSSGDMMGFDQLLANTGPSQVVIPSVLLEWLFFKDMAIFEMFQHGSQEYRAAISKQAVSAHGFRGTVSHSFTGKPWQCGRWACAVPVHHTWRFWVLVLFGQHMCKVNHCMLLQVQTAAPSRQLRILQLGTRLQNVFGQDAVRSVQPLVDV